MTDKESNDTVVKTIDYLTTYSDGEASMCDEALFEQLRLIVNKRRMDINIVTPSNQNAFLTTEKIEKMIRDCLGPGFIPTPPVWPNSAMFYNVDFHSAEIAALTTFSSFGGASVVIDSIPLFDLPGSNVTARYQGAGGQENYNILKIKARMAGHRTGKSELTAELEEINWWQLRDKHRQEKKAKQTAYKEKFFSKRSQKKEVKINPLLAKLVAKK